MKILLLIQILNRNIVFEFINFFFLLFLIKIIKFIQQNLSIIKENKYNLYVHSLMITIKIKMIFKEFLYKFIS